MAGAPLSIGRYENSQITPIARRIAMPNPMAIILFFHIIINVGMNLGILPVIGISLSLVSYGGSNLVFFCIGLGILQSIRTHR